MKLVRVGDLALGQVISSDEGGLAPAVIEAMTAGAPRQFQLRDMTSGERLEKIFRFDVDTRVVLHDVEVEHHIYTNMSGHSIEVRLGPDKFTIEPGGTFHHTGQPRPDVFRPDLWSHSAASPARDRGLDR
jgi:hypothetical protein